MRLDQEHQEHWESKSLMHYKKARTIATLNQWDDPEWTYLPYRWERGLWAIIVFDENNKFLGYL